MLNLDEHIRSTPAIQQEKKLAGIPARAVAFIVDTEVVEVLIMEVDAAGLLTTADSFNELPSTPPLFYVGVVRDGEEVETVQCSEKLWAILCSEPTIINLTGDAIYDMDGKPTRYPSAVAPGWEYVGGEFREKS